MKKFLAMGVLALTVATLSQQQASAWTNLNFGMGLNFGWQSGGNNLAWGAFRNGQPGGPDFPNHTSIRLPSYPGYQPHMGHGMEHGFNPGMPNEHAQTIPGPIAPAAPMVLPSPAPGAPASENQVRYYGAPGFQTVNYAPTYYGGYYVPTYGYGR